MKQAICLLCHGFDSNVIIEFLKQFEGHPDIQFYIHYNDPGFNDTERINNIHRVSEYPGVRYVSDVYNTRRYSGDMVKAEIALYEEALKDPDNGMFHLMSATNYLICSVNYFVDYFSKFSEFDYLTYILWDKRIWRAPQYNRAYTFLQNKYNLEYDSDMEIKAFQWKTLCRKTTEDLIYKYKDDILEIIGPESRQQYGFGAADEYIIPNVIYYMIGNRNFSGSSKVYVNWNSGRDHPLELNINDYKNHSTAVQKELQSNIIMENLSIRKINVNDPLSIEFLNHFKEKHKAREVKLRELYNL